MRWVGEWVGGWAGRRARCLRSARGYGGGARHVREAAGACAAKEAGRLPCTWPSNLQLPRRAPQVSTSGRGYVAAYWAAGEATVVRESDFGANDEMLMLRTHLGALLAAGDEARAGTPSARRQCGTRR